MIDELIKIIIGISGTVLGGILGYFIRLFVEHRLAIDRIKENIKLSEIQKAASKFRSLLIYELIGFYPIDQLWEKNEFNRLFDSLPRINSSAAEFRFFVDRKDDFDKAIKEYNNYCRENTKENVFILDYSKSMQGKSQNDYKEDFKNIVDKLLSFADL